LPIEQVTSGTTYYFHQDQNGSTRALTDSNGNAVRTASYDPYGTLSGSTGTVTTPFGFDGQYTDSESGFQYLRARYYDPSTAQFLSRDPLAGVTRSPYGYAEDSPLNATDPTGLAGCPVQALCDFFGGNGQRITDWFAAHSRDVARYTSATLNAVVAAIPIVGEVRLAELGAEAGQVAAEEAASSGTTLFRAVGPDEAADIAKTGAYRIAGNSVRGGKYFYPTQEQAQSLVDRGWATYVTSATFPQEAIDAATPLNIASEGPAYYIPEEFFPHGPVSFLGGPS
jgi:RHS repeat-associated protein